MLTLSLSNDFPFHQSSIISPHRIEIFISCIKHDSHDMRGMCSETISLCTFCIRITIQIDESPIISNSKDLAWFASVNTIYMRTISCRREYSLNWPSQLVCESIPRFISELAGSGWNINNIRKYTKVVFHS